MKLVQWLIIAVVVALAGPAKAQNWIPLYVVNGVRASGTANSGPATTFICSVLSGGSEMIKIQPYNFSGSLLLSQDLTVINAGTQTVSTNGTALLTEFVLNAPSINPPGWQSYTGLPT